MRTLAIVALATSAILIAGTLFTAPAVAQSSQTPPPSQDARIKPIGQVVSAKGKATITHAKAKLVLVTLGDQAVSAKVGDPVYLGDIVRTGSDGRLGIAFADGTAFKLDNNARMVLNKFVYDANGKANSTLFSLTKGSFTFIAGQTASTGEMKIDTPVATMGIRGTMPRVEIASDGSVTFATLVEKGKNKILEKYGAATIKPHGGGVSPNSGAFEKQKKLNLKICNGC
jgi:hypothetical protein